MASWIVEEPKWQWTLQQYLSRFQDQGILCDTVLACANGKTIRAHSCVLAAASERIRNLLKGVQSNGYTLRMDSVTSTTWTYLIRFIYDGRVSLPLDQVERVRDAANRFQIVPLIKLLDTVDKLRGQITAAESDAGARTSSCRDKDDVIVLDDEDDGDLVVVGDTDVATGVTAPTVDGILNVSGSDSDSLRLDSSFSQRSRLPESSDCSVTSVSVPHFATVSLTHDSCADVASENPLIRTLETNESGAGDRLPDISCQNTDVSRTGLQELSKNCVPSQCSSIVPYTGDYPVLLEEKSASNDTNETSDVPEVICVDSPVTCFSQDDGKATGESNNHSEDVPREISSAISRSLCGSTALPNTPSFLQTTSFDGKPTSDIFSQFIVSRSSKKMLPVALDTKVKINLPVEQALQTIANESIAAHELGESSDHEYVRADRPQSRPWEDKAEDEAPLLCISDVVSLSGQVTDFSEPSNSNFCSLPTTSEAEVDGLRTALMGEVDVLSAAAPFVSVSTPAIVENPFVNSTASTQSTYFSNRAGFSLKARVPLPSTGLRINLSYSARLAGNVSGSNLFVPRPRSANNWSEAQAALRFLLVRSAVSNILSTQNSRKPERFPSQNRSFTNIRLVDRDLHGSTSPQTPQSIISSPSECQKRLPAPPAVSVSLPGLAEEFPVAAVLPFPAIPLPGSVEQFPVLPAVPSGAVSRIPRSVVEPSDSDLMEETYPKPNEFIPCGMDRAKDAPSISAPSPGTTTKRPKLFKQGVGAKRGPKRRINATLSEAERTQTKASNDTTEYAWPGESNQFNGCTKLTTHDDLQRKSQTGKKVTRCRTAKKLTEPSSVVDHTEIPDSLVACNSFADETSFVQPDSTVFETRPRTLSSDVYNFSESDGESNTLRERPQPSITSTQPTGTLDSSAPVAKRRGRKPGQKVVKNPAQTKTAKPGLLDDDDKPKRRRMMKRAFAVNESGGSSSTNEPLPNVQFVGRKIRHEWVVGTEPRSTRWYVGKVLSVVNGKDGERKSQYEVKYEEEDMPYLIDHLVEDYLDGSLRFV